MYIYIYIYVVDILALLSKQSRHLISLGFLVSKDIFMYLYMEDTRICQSLCQMCRGQ